MTWATTKCRTVWLPPREGSVENFDDANPDVAATHLRRTGTILTPALAYERECDLVTAV